VVSGVFKACLRERGLAFFPEVLDEGTGGVAQQTRHVVVQRVHVLGQPAVSVVVHLEATGENC